MTEVFDTAIDEALTAQVSTVSVAKRWLLLQTIYTGPARRAWVRQLPFRPGQPILDVGCGFGAMALELAQQFAAPVQGVDLDRECLQGATTLAHRVPPGAGTVRFSQQDAMQLAPPLAGPYHAICARFLLQHLPDPAAAIRHWAERVAPGGFLVLEDVDDGWTIQYPSPPPAWDRVIRAFRRLQETRGGNRHIGRQLAHLALAQEGFALHRVQLQPGVGVFEEHLKDQSVQFELERVENEREALVAGGLLTEADYAAGVEAFRAALPRWTFVTNATVVVVAQRTQ